MNSMSQVIHDFRKKSVKSEFYRYSDLRHFDFESKFGALTKIDAAGISAADKSHALWMRLDEAFKDDPFYLLSKASGQVKAVVLTDKKGALSALDISSPSEVDTFVFHAQEGSVTNLFLSDENVSNSWIRRIYIEVEKNAELNIWYTGHSSRLNQTRVHFNLVGAHSKLSFIRAVDVQMGEMTDFWITGRHDAVSAISHVEDFVVARGGSKAIFNGNIVIPPTAFKTQAIQRSKILKLSEMDQKGEIQDSDVVSNPRLEIGCDDVQCAHGTAISPVDMNQLFYLESRGFSRLEASREIASGFLKSAFKSMPIGSGSPAMVSASLQRRGWLDESI